MLNPFEIKRNFDHLWVRLRVSNIVTGGGKVTQSQLAGRRADKLCGILREVDFRQLPQGFVAARPRGDSARRSALLSAGETPILDPAYLRCDPPGVGRRGPDGFGKSVEHSLGVNKLKVKMMLDLT